MPTPAFDVVRTEPTGETVVAGHAVPGAMVELLDGDQSLAWIKADESGQFVVVPGAAARGGA